MSKQYPGGIISKTPVVPSGSYSNSTAPGIWTLDQQAYWQKLGQWPNANNLPIDPQFNYVTMLLHGDGTNGAQNNTFLDSSTNNFTITRNGNTTQGSFSPYGSNWSNYFDGSSYLNAPANAAFAFGTGSWTVEAWVFVTTLQEIIVFDTRSSASTAGIACRIDANGTLYYSGSANNSLTSSAITANTWNHVAWVYNGTTLTGYINGVSGGTATPSFNISQNNGVVGRVGFAASGYMLGYISNLRVVKGTAVYTSTFTPSTTPLTAITNTSLLTCQSNRFIDNSANNFTITVNSTPSVQRFNPFGTSTAYSTSVIGGSGYFDGSGDSLACTGTIPATADFTLSLWVYPTNAIGYTQAVEQTGTGNTFTLFLGYTNGQVGIQIGTSAYADYTTGVFKVNQWNYVQVVKASSAFSVYVNGTALSVIGSAGNIGTTSIATGTINFKYNTGCYITDIRIVTSALGNSVPTAPLTAVSGTTMLLNMTNGAIFDNAMMNDLETVGNAQISTSVKKYGTGSLAFDGTGDYLFGGNYLSATFGTGNFTIEMWLYYSSSATGSDFVIDCRPTSVNGAYPAIYIDSGVMYYYVDTANRITSSAISTNTWMHVAVCRSGTSTKMFINGTQTGSTYTDSTNYICRTDGPVIGADRNFGDSLLGYIDDFRITKGYARYTSNFTAPTAAFSDTGPI